jgi:hypothetical protein
LGNAIFEEALETKSKEETSAKKGSALTSFI